MVFRVFLERFFGFYIRSTLKKNENWFWGFEDLRNEDVKWRVLTDFDILHGVKKPPPIPLTPFKGGRDGGGLVNWNVFSPTLFHWVETAARWGFDGLRKSRSNHRSVGRHGKESAHTLQKTVNDEGCSANMPRLRTCFLGLDRIGKLPRGKIWLCFHQWPYSWRYYFGFTKSRGWNRLPVFASSLWGSFGFTFFRRFAFIGCWFECEISWGMVALGLQSFDKVIKKMIFICIDDQIIIHCDFSLYDIRLVCYRCNSTVNKHWMGFEFDFKIRHNG